MAEDERRGPLQQRRERRRRLAEFGALLPQLTPRIWVTPLTIAACIVVYGAMVASGVSPTSPTAEELAAWGAGFGPWTHGGEQWRLLTYGFVHIGFVHLALNVAALWVVGVLVERMLGNLATLGVVLLTGVASALVSSLWQPEFVACGASGIVFGLGGALLAVWFANRQRIPAEVLMRSPDPTMFAGGGFGLVPSGPITFLAISLVYGFFTPDIDNSAHVGGLAAGLLVGSVLTRPLELGATRPVWRIAAAGGLAVGLGVAVLLSATSGAVRHLDNAAELGDRGEFAAALAECDRALELDATSARAHGLRGWCLACLGRFDEALPELDRAVDLDPEDGWAQAQRGWCLAELGRFADAVPALELSVRTAPDDAWSRGQLAWCLGELGRHQEALPVNDRALELEPDAAWLHRQRGWILQAVDRPDDAITAYLRALALDPNEEYARNALAELTAARGERGR